MAGGEELERVLGEQAAYYQALGEDYLHQGLDLPGGGELARALEAFRPTGRVLELACGPGVWTGQLLRHATEVTAVDASPEMLAAAAARAGSDRVRFVRADLFDWVPDRRYDVVFFGFWLSHVPPERFDAFWSLVAAGLAEDGRVFFADDAYRTPDELVHGPSSSTIRRRLADGDVAAATRALGRPHRVEGVVVRGHMRGRGLGFPTANLETPPHTATPADGVYAGWLTSLDLAGAETARWPAAISVGTNPTFGLGDRTVEAYALDRDDLDLYGVHAAIDFTARLRGTERFDSVRALITQMHADVAQARALTSG